MGVNVEYLGRIGYNCGRLMQGFLINTHLYLQEIKSKKVILLGMGENSIYAEKSLKEKGIDIFGYADNSEKLQGRGIDGKNQIYSPYDLFPNDDYYFIITVKHELLESVRYGHTYQYTKEELITIFERAGLKIERYDLSDSNGHNIVLVKNK